MVTGDESLEGQPPGHLDPGALGHEQPHGNVDTEVRRHGARPGAGGDHEVIGLQEVAGSEFQAGDPVSPRGEAHRLPLLHVGAQAFGRLGEAQGVLVRLDLAFRGW